MKKNNIVGSRIAEIRREKELSQEALAASLHVTRQTISNWESGKSLPDIEMLKSLAAVLSVPIEKLIYSEQDAATRREDFRIPNSIGRLCFGLAIAVYIIGFFAGISGCAALEDVDNTLSIWFAGLLLGSLFLALSEIIRLLATQK